VGLDSQGQAAATASSSSPSVRTLSGGWGCCGEGEGQAPLPGSDKDYAAAQQAGSSSSADAHLPPPTPPPPPAPPEGFWTLGTILQAGLAYALLNNHGWWGGVRGGLRVCSAAAGARGPPAGLPCPLPPLPTGSPTPTPTPTPPPTFPPRRVLVAISAIPLGEPPPRAAWPPALPRLRSPAAGRRLSAPPDCKLADPHPPRAAPSAPTTPPPLAVLQLVLLPFVPESPRYLLVKGRTADAEKALSRWGVPGVSTGHLQLVCTSKAGVRGRAPLLTQPGARPRSSFTPCPNPPPPGSSACAARRCRRGSCRPSRTSARSPAPACHVGWGRRGEGAAPQGHAAGAHAMGHADVGQSAGALPNPAAPACAPTPPPKGWRRMAATLANGGRDIGASIGALLAPELRWVTLALLLIWVGGGWAGGGKGRGLGGPAPAPALRERGAQVAVAGRRAFPHSNRHFLHAGPSPAVCGSVCLLRHRPAHRQLPLPGVWQEGVRRPPNDLPQRGPTRHPDHLRRRGVKGEGGRGGRRARVGGAAWSARAGPGPLRFVGRAPLAAASAPHQAPLTPKPAPPLPSPLSHPPPQLPGLVFSLILAHFLSRKHAFAIPMACIAAVLAPTLSRRLTRAGSIACLWLARFFIYAAYNLLWAVTPESFPTSSRCAAGGGGGGGGLGLAGAAPRSWQQVSGPLHPPSLVSFKSPAAVAQVPKLSTQLDPAPAVAPPPSNTPKVLCPGHHQRHQPHRRPHQPLRRGRGGWRRSDVCLGPDAAGRGASRRGLWETAAASSRAPWRASCRAVPRCA
jgi:hypothetical protein